MAKRCETLCMSCVRDICECPWKRDRIPVKGWQAQKTVVKNENVQRKSFRVINCPLYMTDERARVLNTYKAWTKEEINYLRMHYGRVPIRVIAEKLGRQFDSVDGAIARFKRKGIIL